MLTCLSTESILSSDVVFKNPQIKIAYIGILLFVYMYRAVITAQCRVRRGMVGVVRALRFLRCALRSHLEHLIIYLTQSTDILIIAVRNKTIHSYQGNRLKTS